MSTYIQLSNEEPAFAGFLLRKFSLDFLIKSLYNIYSKMMKGKNVSESLEKKLVTEMINGKATKVTMGQLMKEVRTNNISLTVQDYKEYEKEYDALAKKNGLTTIKGEKNTTFYLKDKNA